MTASTSALMDRIRGVAALVVAAVHVFQVFLLPYIGLETPAHLWTSLAATYAVLLFFVVSGFMIYWSIRGHTTEDGFNWRSYATARLLRIYPPLLAAILITAGVVAIIHTAPLLGATGYRLGDELFLVRDKAEFTAPTLLATLFLSYGTIPLSPPPLEMNGPLWTLGYEFWFYFFVMFAVNAKAKRWVVGVAPFAAFVALSLVGGNLLQLIFFCVWMTGFGLGWLSARDRVPSPRALLWIIAGLVALYVVFAGNNFLEMLLHPYAYQWLIVVTGAIFAATIALAIQLKPAPRRGPAAFAAGFSYTLYVIHFPLMMLAFSILHPTLYSLPRLWSAFAAVAVLCLTVLASWGVSLAVENRPAIRSVLAGFRAANRPA